MFAFITIYIPVGINSDLHIVQGIVHFALLFFKDGCDLHCCVSCWQSVQAKVAFIY